MLGKSAGSGDEDGEDEDKAVGTTHDLRDC